MVGAWLLLLTVSGPTHAQDLEDGIVLFQPSLEATVRVLPQRDPSRIELVVHQNQAPLDDQLAGKRTPWVLDMTAWSTGGGTWFMVVDLARDDLGVRLSQKAPRWELRLVPGGRTVPEPPTTATVAEILSGELPREVGHRGLTALHPLDGDVAQGRLDARIYSPSYPRWEPPSGRSAEAELLADPTGDPLIAVDRYRHVLTSSTVPRYQAQALYQLGHAHLAAGLYREASHYLGRLDALAGHFPEIHVRLAQSRAALAAGDPELALSRCVEAEAVGAREVHVLECVGSVALETGSPSPSEVGRALAVRTARAETLLLAAQLLQQDQRHGEARALLAGIVPVLSGDLGARARLSLGDSLFAEGELEAARVAWQSVTGGGFLGALVRERLRLRAMVEAGPGGYPAYLPELYRVARDEGPAGAEALYTLSQVAEMLGDLDGAADHLATLLARYGPLLDGSDVPHRLWTLTARRLEQLDRAGRELELAAFYEEHYSGRLRHLVRDTGPLAAVADAYESLGLYAEALDVAREIFSIHTRQDRDEPASLVQLARLYALSGRLGEALETLTYTRRLRSSGPWRGEMHLLEGQILQELGRTADAAKAWREAARFADAKHEAGVRLALQDATTGRCDRAVPALKGLVALPLSSQPEAVTDGRAWLALARCQLDTGEREAALASAREAAGRSDDALHKRYATYLASLAAGGEGFNADALRSDDDLWAALGREAEADAAFEAELDGYRKR